VTLLKLDHIYIYIYIYIGELLDFNQILILKDTLVLKRYKRDVNIMHGIILKQRYNQRDTGHYIVNETRFSFGCHC
jgi:hypothetical protein